jgi:hypothetical protein
MGVCQFFELLVGFLFGGLVEYECFQEFEVLLGEALVGEVRIFGQHIRRQVEMVVLAVEQDQVGEGFRREGRVRKQEIQFFESTSSILLDIHECLVVKGDRI